MNPVSHLQAGVSPKGPHVIPRIVFQRPSAAPGREVRVHEGGRVRRHGVVVKPETDQGLLAHVRDEDVRGLDTGGTVNLRA